MSYNSTVRKDNIMILIIDHNKRNADSISDMFYYMGILSKSASPVEALSEISSVYKAVLISEPSAFPDIKDYTSKLSAYYSDIPIFSVSSDPENAAYKGVFRKNYDINMYSSAIAMDISSELRAKGVTPIGTYRLAGIDASCDTSNVTAFDKAIPFTKTEVMILRYLICTYPAPQTAKSILKYAFKQNRKPDITGIRTHISVMNKKFRQIRDRNIIVSIPEKGYVISTPEILKSLATTG